MRNDWKSRAKQKAAEITRPARFATKPHTSPGTNPANGDGIPKPLAPPKDVLAYYDSGKKTYWARNVAMEWQELTQANLKLLLRANGFSTERLADNGLNYADDKLLKISQENGVHFAGPVAGFAPGLFEVSGSRVLVTRGPRMIAPKKGSWKTLGNLLAQLLGSQRKYFAAWIKWALRSLQAGPPWNPGQLLGIAGPPGCGKSLLQQLVTLMLGGRAAKPYRYMIGETQFNSELFGAEHLMIEDEPSSNDLRTRRHFGAQIKNMTVNKEQSFHGKGRNALTLQPFLRLSITLNDEAESLMVLPPLDADLRDKIILLRANPVTFPFPSKQFPTNQHYWAQLVSELPAWHYYLANWEIPEDMQDQRFGVVGFQNEDLLFEVDSLSPELKLWQLVEASGIMGDLTGHWEGTAIELERELRSRDRSGEVGRLLSFNTASGVYLSRLRSKRPDEVSQRKERGNRTVWTLKRGTR